jgi:hypothetical protein
MCKNDIKIKDKLIEHFQQVINRQSMEMNCLRMEINRQIDTENSSQIKKLHDVIQVLNEQLKIKDETIKRYEDTITDNQNTSMKLSRIDNDVHINDLKMENNSLRNEIIFMKEIMAEVNI